MYQLVLVVLAVNLGSGGIHSSTAVLGQYPKKEDCQAALGGSIEGRIADKVSPRANNYFDIEPICVQLPSNSR